MSYNIDDYPELAERFSYVNWTYFCVKIPLEELQAIYSADLNEEELKLVKQDTFKLMKVSHSYFLVMELCKLLEPGSQVKNISSLSFLAKKLTDTFPSEHVELIRMNKRKLEIIKKDIVTQEIRAIRNGKLAHTDNSYKPNSFRFLSKAEILHIGEQLDEILIIINSYYSTFFGKYIYNMSPFEGLTRGFIKNISKWSAFGREELERRKIQGDK